MVHPKPMAQYPKGGPDWATVSRWVDDGRPDINPDGSPVLECRWSETCTRGAIGAAAHPSLGVVPCCRRCAEDHHLEVLPLQNESFR